MPNDHGQIVPAAQRDIATLPLNQAIDAYAPNFAAVLPSNVSLEHFKRMVVTAINTNPDLAGADRRSLFNACIKCASDGLLPDGREAALVVFNTKIKKKVNNAWVEEWVKLAQFMPMIAGIRKRMRNSGEVVSATAEVVCENDEFDYALGDNPFILHKPAPFGRSRGKPVGAYAIIKLKHGEPLRDVMRKEEIEAARSKSRAKDSLMWTDFWGEGAKKTVLRRCAKAAPQSAVLETLLARDDELPEMPPLAELAPPEPEPPRGAAITHQPEPEQPSFLVIDADGEQHEHDTVDEATRALVAIFDDAARRGPSHLAAARENNATMIAEFGDPYLSGPDAPPSHSPAGNSNGNPTPRKEDHAVAAGNASPGPAEAPKSAGEEMPDMLGGKPRAAGRNLYIPKLHKPAPTDNDLNSINQTIDEWLSDGESPAAIRAANADGLENLRRVDPHYYEDVARKMGW